MHSKGVNSYNMQIIAHSSLLTQKDKPGNCSGAPGFYYNGH